MRLGGVGMIETAWRLVGGVGVGLAWGCASEHGGVGRGADETGAWADSGVADPEPDEGEPSTPSPGGGSETCLWVQGGADRVRATVTGTPTGASPQTVEAWVRTTSTDDQVAVAQGIASPGKGLYLGTSGGYLMASTAGLFTVDEGFFVADGGWHHIALTFDGQAATFTVDGERGDPFVLEGLALVEGEVVAGAAATNGGLPWVGWVDDVKIFARERTAADLEHPEEEDTRGLVLWWDFEVEGHGAGVVVPDQSGSGNDGVSGGSPDTPEFLPCR